MGEGEEALAVEVAPVVGGGGYRAGGGACPVELVGFGFPGEVGGGVVEEFGLDDVGWGRDQDVRHGGGGAGREDGDEALDELERGWRLEEPVRVGVFGVLAEVEGRGAVDDEGKTEGLEGAVAGFLRRSGAEFGDFVPSWFL